MLVDISYFDRLYDRNFYTVTEMLFLRHYFCFQVVEFTKKMVYNIFISYKLSVEF